jgi:hypothetical protein
MISKTVNNSFFYLFVFTLFLGVLLYDMIGFKLMDEISGFILLIIYGVYIFTTKSKKFNIGLFITLFVFIFYLYYSISASYNTKTAIILDFLIQIRPYLTFFIVAQISPSFSESQKSLLKRLCILMWLLFIPIGIYGLVNSTFLHSVFGHPSNYIAGISSLSLVYLFCSNFSIRDRFLFIIMFSAGLLATNTIFYTIFLLTCGILLYFHHSDILKFNLRTGIAIGVIAFIILHIIRVQITTDLLSVNNLTAEYDLPTRSILYQTAIDIISKDFVPLGSGFASFGTDASGLYYSEIYSQYGLNSIDGLTPQNWYSVSDSYYPSLAQFGIIGIILYLFFWGSIIYKSFLKFRQNCDIHLFVITLILISFIFIENLSDSFLTSNKGYYMMMFLGVLFGKKKQVFHNRENSQKMDVIPVQANTQRDNPAQKMHENEDMHAEKEQTYQMPPTPIREKDVLKKKKDSIEYASASHSSEKNEIDENNYYDEDEDYYFDDNEDFNETENELIEIKAASTSQGINNKDSKKHQKDVLSETNENSNELQSYDPLVDEEDETDLLSPLQDDNNTVENNIKQKADEIITIYDQEVTNATGSGLNDNIIPINDSPTPDQASNTDLNTELVKDNEDTHHEELLTYTPLIEDNEEKLQDPLSSIQNDANKVESTILAEVPNDTEDTTNISGQEVSNVTEPNLTDSTPIESSITNNDMSDSNNPDKELIENNEQLINGQLTNNITTNDNDEIKSDHADEPEVTMSEHVDDNIINPESIPEKDILVDENININKLSSDFSLEIKTTESSTDNLSKPENDNPDTELLENDEKVINEQAISNITSNDKDEIKSGHADEPEITMSEYVDDNIINPESIPEKDILVNENIIIDILSSDFSPEIKTAESSTDNLSKPENDNPDIELLENNDNVINEQAKSNITSNDKDEIKSGHADEPDTTNKNIENEILPLKRK